MGESFLKFLELVFVVEPNNNIIVYLFESMCYFYCCLGENAGFKSLTPQVNLGPNNVLMINSLTYNYCNRIKVFRFMILLVNFTVEMLALSIVRWVTTL